MRMDRPALCVVDYAWLQRVFMNDHDKCQTDNTRPHKYLKQSAGAVRSGQYPPNKDPTVRLF